MRSAKLQIEQISQRLIEKYPLFKKVIEQTPCIAAEHVSSIGTNGREIFYNPEYLYTLREGERLFVFAHEICHIAFGHVFKSAEKETQLWNLATDAVLNSLLEKDGLWAVKGSVKLSYASYYDAESLYRKLLREETHHSEQLDEDDSEADCIHTDVGHDTHRFWNVKEHGARAEDTSQYLEMQALMQAVANVNILAFGEHEAFRVNALLRQVEDFEELMEMGLIGVGKTTKSLDRNVGSVDRDKPLIDWKRLLKEAVPVDVDWSYQNATIEHGVVVPHLEEIRTSEAEILLDTSGSIRQELLKTFLKECKNILKACKVRVGCFDTKFYGFHEVKNDDDIDKIPFIGGGGTDFNTAVNAFSRNAENKIIFTDGNADMPEKVINVIWVVFGGEKIRPKGGRVIEIDEKQLLEKYTL